MKILMLSDVYLPRINGVTFAIKGIRKSLSRHNIDIDLIVPCYNRDMEETPGIIRVPSYKIPFSPEDRLINYRAMRSTVMSIASNYDLIHVQTPFVAHYIGVQAAKRYNKPVITTYHTLFEEYFQHYLPFISQKFLKRFVKRISRHQCQGLNGVIVPSQAIYDRLHEYGVTTPLHQIPTGIDVGHFSSGNRTIFRDQHGITHDQPVALYVGRVAREKNIELLMHSFTHVVSSQPEAMLLIAGDGPAMEELKELSYELNLTANIKFLGYVDNQEELPNCYAGADVFVFASRTETQGLVLLEAMAAGLPVVAIAEMGTIEILKGNPACLTPSPTMESFGEAMAKLLTNQQLCLAMSSTARDQSKSWSEDLTSQKLVDLYSSLIQQPV
jgi:1,2-diacylglycerol 3-alpha-glucosyltransferase